jgi:hypothetical protein
MAGQGEGLRSVPARAATATATRKTTPAPRPRPERSDDFVHLSLNRLRSYRQALTEEENRVSYWRRIVQARLDLVRAGATGDPAHAANLRQVLTQASETTGRKALVTVVPIDDIPPLPDLAGLWERDVRPGDDKHNEQLAHDLAIAERELSEYRAALHARIAAATAELIARYRDQPGLCLTALPVREDRGRRAAM